MEEQRHDIRLRNWENNFTNNFKKIEKYLDAVRFVEKDTAYIRLTELSNNIDEWEHIQRSYCTDHKTDIYHDFQDFKSKFLIQLDSIDISSNPIIKSDRSTLYGRIEQLSKAFDHKIHNEHYTCSFCVQVKEVPINL